MTTQTRTKYGHFPEIVSGLSVLDLEGVQATDKVAFATGYLTGKLGVNKDPLAEYIGAYPNDYDHGYQLGKLVFEGGVKPGWDRTPPMN